MLADVQADAWRARQDIVRAQLIEQRQLVIVAELEVADLQLQGTLYSTSSTVLAHVEHRVTHVVYTALLLPLSSVRTPAQVCPR